VFDISFEKFLSGSYLLSAEPTSHSQTTLAENSQILESSLMTYLVLFIYLFSIYSSAYQLISAFSIQ